MTSDFYPVQAYYEEEAVSGSPRSKLGRPSDHLLTPCARLVEQCAVGYLRVQAGGTAPPASPAWS